jgi:hypothetical protein
MAVTSERITTIKFTGGANYYQEFSAASNTNSPASENIYTLAVGANTITLPTGGSTPKGATIIPPVGNEETITLKGVSGDTGIALHKTDPTSITFDSPAPASFVLTAGDEIEGLRIVWS